MAKKRLPQKKTTKANPKPKKKVTLYTKVVRATRKELKAEGYELSYNDARKFVKEHIYANFKGQKPNAVKVKDIREYAKSQIEAILKKQPEPPKYIFIDPRAIPEIDVSDIAYWDLNEFLNGQGDRNIYQSRALQGANAGKNLRFEVIASATDRTGELNILEYDGYTSGVREMVERVRQEVNNGYGFFFGVVGLREGKTDDNDPDSYILQFVLHIDDQPVVPLESLVTPIPITPPTVEDIIEAQKRRREEATKKDEAERRKAEAELSRKRRGVKRPTGKKKVKEEPVVEPPPPKKTTKTRGDRVLALNEQKIKELEMLRKDLDDKVISKKEYKKERDRVQTQYEEALKKLKRGGMI